MDDIKDLTIILAEKEHDEILDAKSYTKLALGYRDNRPELARVLYGISLEEMEHMEKLHDAVMGIIKGYKKENGAMDADTLAVYNYLRKKNIDAEAEARTLQGMYKEA